MDTVIAAPVPAPVGVVPIFSANQAKAGQKVYFAECVRCHTADHFVGPQFTTAWNTRRVYDLYDIVSTTMPQDSPGNLTADQYLNVVAFMLHANGAKSGTDKLTTDTDTMKHMRIGLTENK